MIRLEMYCAAIMKFSVCLAVELEFPDFELDGFGCSIIQLICQLTMWMQVKSNWILHITTWRPMFELV